MQKQQQGRKVRTLSLFSGAGGLDIGFHDANFDIVAAVEIEPSYAETLAANTGKGKYFGPKLVVHCEDIRKFDATAYIDAGIECIIGGPPCQTFSAAGRRSGGVLGTDDLRGQLFSSYVDILNTIRPKVFVFENVYGLPGANGGGPWREIVGAFTSAGYELSAEVVDAADYGVPQHRERLIMVGSRVGTFEFPEPTHGPDSSSGLPLISAASVLENLVQVPTSAEGLGGLYGHLLPLVPPGLNYSFFTREMGHPAPLFAWRSKFHDFLHKADPQFPVRTIKSKPGKFTGPFHWDNRHFTADELKRLQSFPDEYLVTGNFNKVVEQIGNSVPPTLAYVIAMSVKEQLLRRHKGELTFPVRPPGFQSTFRKRQRERTTHFQSVAEAAIAKLTPEHLRTIEVQPVQTDDYFAAFNGWFERLFVTDRSLTRSHDTVFRVKTRRIDNSLLIYIDRATRRDSRPIRASIDITGLEKYLDHTDSVRVVATLASLREWLAVWAIIERELVRQSRFFSLIDIYGHYANRGDTVSIRTQVAGNGDPLETAMNFFGDSTNCGIPMTFGAVTKMMAVEPTSIREYIDELRLNRWDVRVKQTHPTLADSDILCTYPFPTLSERAHFDKGSAHVLSVDALQIRKAV